MNTPVTYETKSSDLVVMLSEYPADDLAAVLGRAIICEEFRIRMRKYKKELAPLAMIGDSDNNERISTLQKIAGWLSEDPKKILNPARASDGNSRDANRLDVLMLLELLHGEDSENLALLLVEGTRDLQLRRSLDEYQAALYPLVGWCTNDAARERIYRIRLICGLLAINTREDESQRDE